jgi:transcriptional regulator with XRE-family HTH domain
MPAKTALSHLFRRNLKAAISADREIRSQASLSKVLAARGVKVSQSSISRILSGDQSPTLDVVARLAKAFEYEPWQMLVDSFQPSNPPITRQEDERLKALYENLQKAMQEVATYVADHK